MKAFYICILSLFLWVPGAVLAGPSQPYYTLKQLCTKANENAERIKIAQEDTYYAEQDKKRAQSVLIPRATLYGSYLNYKSDDIYTPDVTAIGAKLTQSFTLNGRELIAYNVSKLTIEKVKFTESAVRSDYMFQVAQTFIQALSAKRLVEVVQAEVDRLTTYKDSVTEKLNVGNVTKTAMYRAQAELSKAQTNRIVAVNNVEIAKAGIVRLTGVEDEFSISSDGIKDIENFNITFEQIKARALENRFEIKDARKAVEIAHKTISYQKGDYWPSLDLEGGYREKNVSYETQAGPDSEYDTHEAYIQAQLVFTFYDGGLRKAQVRQATAQERQAKLALANIEKEVVLQSKEAFLDFKTARSTLTNLADEVKSAKENYNAVQMQFKYGMADSIDIMDANTLLVDAERRMSNARYSFFLAILKIIYTQGDILTYLL